MNRLPDKLRAKILHQLCEGTSLRGVSRIEGVTLNTVIKLMVDAGYACADFHDRTLQNLTCHRIQADEMWAFCYAKNKNAEAALSPEAGNVWTWLGIDQDTKLMVSWLSGGRDAETADKFMRDLAGRLTHRVQLTTDGLHAYLEAVEGAFGGDIDYGMLVKMYGENGLYEGTERRQIVGHSTWITTAHIERQNLTARMSNRRLIRKTNGFSKKLLNHELMWALYITFYNFCRPHSSLGKRTTPAMAAGLVEYAYGFDWIVDMVNEANPPRKRGPYKTRVA